MGAIVTDGALVICTCGSAPCTMHATNQQFCLVSQKPAATILDMGSANMSGFGMCTTLINPAVASATAAALGVLTPQPCTLVPAGPWINPKMTPLIKNVPCLCSESRMICGLGMGQITISMPGQVSVML